MNEEIVNLVVQFIIDHYKLNEWIYPNVISRNCKLDKNTTATVLNELVKKKCLDEHWLIRCPYCRILNTDRIYVHYESVPAWFICPYCDTKIVTSKNNFIEYTEPAYQIRSE